MKHRKSLIGVLIFALCAVLVGCSGTTAENRNSETSAAATNEPSVANKTQLTFWNFKTDPIWEASAMEIAEQMNIDLSYEYLDSEKF